MSGAAKVNFNVQNLTDTVVTTTAGIGFVLGRSIRGPWANPKDIFTSWPEFIKVFGGLSNDFETPKHVKRILEGGGAIRFCRVGNYADISDAETLTAIKANILNTTEIKLTGNLTTGGVYTLTIGQEEPVVINYTTSQANTLTAIANAIATGTGGNVNVEGNVIKILSSVTDVRVSSNNAENTFETINKPNGLIANITAKYAGADTNNIIIMLEPGSNGQPNSFNLRVRHLFDNTVKEDYINITIPTEVFTVPGYQPDYLKDIVNNSRYIDVTYPSMWVLPVLTEAVTLRFTDGDDGNDPTEADYIGDTNSGTGLHSFDDYDDSYYIGVLENIDIHNAGISYADSRKDLLYIRGLNSTDKAGLLAEKNADNMDTQYVIYIGGKGLTRNPNTLAIENSSSVADTMILAINSDLAFGPWYSFGGPNRGVVKNVLGVNVNFGTPARSKDLDELANRGINMFINKNNSTKFWGNFTGQSKYNQERFISIVKLIIYMQKSLRPTLETFLEEPNDFSTWKRIYYTVKPFLDGLITKRALYSYEWLGDQDAKTLRELVINDPTDVQNGKYKVRLNFKGINSLQDISIDMYLTPAGLDFELVTELI